MRDGYDEQIGKSSCDYVTKILAPGIGYITLKQK